MKSIRFNSCEVRLAENEADIDAAQTLRYQVFFDEMRGHGQHRAAASLDAIAIPMTRSATICW
ncbi:MAG: hypothetical protein ACJ0HN_01205 [Alphaproteobacteria bacterium]